MPFTKKEIFNNLDFIAMLMHDIKTPVKAQIRAMNLLYSGVYGNFEEDVQNIFANIIASNKYMQYLIDNVLSEYRINKGKFILNKTKNDLRKSIEESLLSVGILFEAKGQKVEISYMTDDFICLYDEIEIQRVIINLLSNAFEYAKENSTIKLTVSKDGARLKIKLTSKSSLIKKENEFKIDYLKAGSGLGLLICEKIIQEHSGEISHISINGEYSSEFWLPL